MAYIQKRTSQKGKASYRVQVRLKGHPTQTATFERKTDAQKWAQQTEAAIREGRHFKTTEAKKHTLGELIDRYLKDELPKKSTIMEKQAVQFRWWKDQIGDYSLANITPALIAEYRDRLFHTPTPTGTKRSPSTVNRYLAALSHALNVAVKEWGWLDDSPMRKVNRLKEPKGRVRFLDEQERTSLLTACRETNHPFLYAVVLLALSTGARKMEILNLRWKDVDLNKGTAILHETKNGERRALPLSGPALDELRALSKVRRIDTTLIFPGRNPKTPFEIRKPWIEVLQKAGIQDFRFHDLRHSAASYLAMSGATLAEIAEILGHKTLQMVKRYAHLSEQHTAGVVEKMNQKFLGDFS